MVPLLVPTMVLALTKENVFSPCTSAQLKLSSPQTGRFTKISCSLLCKNRACAGFRLIGDQCTLDDGNLPDSEVTVTEGCFKRMS